jgi:hypothetical protein
VDQRHWPSHVQQISLQDLGQRLGMDGQQKLYWDGQPLVTDRFLALTRWEKIWAIIAAIALTLGGVGEFVHGWTSYNEWACAMHWSLAVCPPDSPKVPPVSDLHGGPPAK